MYPTKYILNMKLIIVVTMSHNLHNNLKTLLKLKINPTKGLKSKK